MPRIDDEPVVAKRPFKKKAYRPWNLMDDEFPIAPKVEEPKEVPVEVAAYHVPELVTNKESISNQIETDKKPISNHIVTNTPALVTSQETNSNRLSNPISNQIHEVAVTQKSGFYVDVSARDLVLRVAGLQRKILFSIVEDCIVNGTLSSSPISTETLKKLTNADKDTVKTATQRLINKNLITRGYGKKGKGGFAIFCITEEIRNAVIEAQKRGHSNNELVTNWVTNKEPLVTYSSSSLNTNTTTRENEIKTAVDIPSEWESMDIEPLSAIGFTKTHLRQIIMDNKMPSDMLQDSIYAFAFDLENNNKQKSLKSPPLNYFMGIMRSGTPYAPPANYESPQDKAMRIYLERKRESETKRNAMENELFLSAYSDWEQSLAHAEKESILPDNIKNSRLLSDKTVYLRNHFKEQCWPSLKEKFLMKTLNELGNSKSS